MNIFYRYGMAKEKNLFLQNKEFFSGLVLPAHIALDQKDSLPEWLAANNINYFVDPITYIFTEETAKLYNKKMKLRRSYKKFIEALRLESINFINENLTIDFFKSKGSFDDKKVSDFVESIMRVQIDIKKLDKEIDKETKEFIDFFKEKGMDYPINIALDSGHNPLFYTSPGFFFDSPEDEWFKLNIKLMQETIKHSEDQKAYGYLPICKSLMSQDFNKQIIKSIPDNLNGIVVWFEDFEDTLASEEELKFVASTIKGLSEKGLDVINLYGGFFSSLLCNMGCVGYSSGLCYDTSRSRIIEPGGGPLPLRYYIPEINKFMRQSDAERFYNLLSPSCECKICKVIKDDATKEEGVFKIDLFIESFFNYDEDIEGDFIKHEEALKNHFIYSTKSQIDRVNKIGLKNFLIEKKSIYDKLVKNSGESIANNYASHLPRWVNVLNKFL